MKFRVTIDLNSAVFEGGHSSVPEVARLLRWLADLVEESGELPEHRALRDADYRPVGYAAVLEPGSD